MDNSIAKHCSNDITAECVVAFIRRSSSSLEVYSSIALTKCL